MELVVTHVQKNYANVAAIKNLSFNVSQGEIFALLGPNGAGKSSLVRMLTGFTQPDSGTITLTMDGNKYSSIPSHTLGYLPENRGLYPEKSLMKNLIYFAQLNGVDKKSAIEEAEYWLERFDILERKDDQLKTLSKGNQQKVQLITAVIHKPKWVILDEPFSGLDPVNQEKVVIFLSELRAKGMTVILSAHQMAMVEKLADRMLLMNLGETVLYGSLQEIQQKIDSSTHLTAQFSEELDSSKVSEILADTKHSLTNNKTLELSLTPLQSINELLQRLTSIGDLEAMHSKKMDLHQLYLNAIANHGAINND
ncbi:MULTISPECIES: ABC transporter ATP-binding protein [unclassified Colwellia]|uniref:ABC transporter ATP-binding protein n=1 Tax=unclassified Colwellia TaxID=196834 RepID=UPI0015F52FB8|nr:MULTISPECIES: ATP-binding cassette domain-containing protein [unclassified Colwellia]MBA6256650.1 ATP-binding cassette domain-containing protein [Colwellia sp. MB3u-28]MBA6261365.1 ATP-binding cassette domain-containing protein [Colwellia sp. MB3u-41]